MNGEKKDYEINYDPQQIDRYRKERNRFFSNISPMQMAIETVRISKIEPDFSNGVGEIAIALYNVRFLSQKWDVIMFKTGRDTKTGEPPNKRKFGHYISYREGQSYPEIIASHHYTNMKDKFGYRIWKSSLPSGQYDRFPELSPQEQLLMVRLLQTAELVLSKLDLFPNVGTNERAKK